MGTVGALALLDPSVFDCIAEGSHSQVTVSVKQVAVFAEITNPTADPHVEI